MSGLPAAVAGKVPKQDFSGLFEVIANEAQPDEENPHGELLIVCGVFYRRYPPLFLCHLTDRSDQAVVGIGFPIEVMQGKPRELQCRFGLDNFQRVRPQGFLEKRCFAGDDPGEIILRFRGNPVFRDLHDIGIVFSPCWRRFNGAGGFFIVEGFEPPLF